MPNFTEKRNIPHEQEYNTRHGILAIPNEVCGEVRRQSRRPEIQQNPEDFAKQLPLHNRRSNNLPMRLLRWLSPTEVTVQYV